MSFFSACLFVSVASVFMICDESDLMDDIPFVPFLLNLL